MLPSQLRLSLLAAALCCGMIASSPGQSPVSKEQEAKLIAVLQQADAQPQAKADACRELARIGTGDAVAALAGLLADEKLAHMARYGLETIPGPAVDEALRAALAKLKGPLLVGVIGSIGMRHDAQAVPALVKLLQDADGEVAQASARALGSIATPEAVQGLQSALAGVPAANRLAICEGLFRCAESLSAKGSNAPAIAIYDALRNSPQAPHQVLAGAWRGAILTRQNDGAALLLEAIRSSDPQLATAALTIAMEMKAAGVSAALAGELAAAPAARQIQLANVLGQRGDTAALPALLALAKAGDPAARVAAIRAATRIGDATAAAAFIALLADPDKSVAQAATAGLAGLPGTAVDATVIGFLLDSPDTALQLKMLEMLRQRRITSALPRLLKLMDDPNPALRSPALTAYAELAGEAELAPLLDKLVTNTRAGEISAIERALGSICGAASDPQTCEPALLAALPKASPEAKPALLRTLRVTGSAQALKAVRAAVGDSNKDIHSAAIRVLSEWKTGDAAPLLLELATTSSAPVDKILSLRGYLGMPARADIAPPEKLAICRRAAPMIQRDDEKLLLLGALANLANPESLDLVLVYLTDPAVKNEAIATVLTIAGKRPAKQHAAVTQAALEKVLAAAAADNPKAVTRAQELLKQLANEK